MTDYQDVEFWRSRITDVPQEGPGKPDNGFEKVDEAYKRITNFHIRPEDKVLDAGCGVGRFSDWFQDYVGFDFVPEFVESAKELHPDKTFLVADFNKTLPFKDKEFDWVISVSSYQYCETNELRRVAKHVLVMNYSNPEEYEILGDIYGRKSYALESDSPNYLDNGNMQETIDFLCEHITPDDTFIDIGAHIGCVFIEVMDRCKPKMGYAFEPTVETFKQLKKNCKRNLHTPYEVVNKALMDYTGEVDFYEASWGSPSNTTVDRFEGRIKPKKFPCVDLNSYKIDGKLVIKLDAELAEQKIWKGMSRHIPNIKAMTMEWFNMAMVETNLERVEFLKQIRKDGFGIYSIDNRRKAISDDDLLSSGKLDLILLPCNS